MTTTTPEQFVEAARAYLGAPFRHQGWDATGMDCRGLLLRAACDVGIFDEAAMEKARELQVYGREPDGRMARLLKQHCNLMTEAVEIHAGDIIAIRYVDEPQHLVIVTRPTQWGPQVIHAFNTGGVIEHRLDAIWLKSHRARIHGIFRLKAFGSVPIEEDFGEECPCGGK